MACPIRSRRRPPLLLLVLCAALSLLLCESCLGAALCPRSCTCPQPTELHCTFRSLSAVPHNVNPHVERVNLGFNRISRVSEKSFSGLTHLEMLLIHGNDLHSLPDGAFKDLSALQMLKLSYNHLREVSRHTFVGLWSLTRLHLDHNSLESIDPDTFHGLTSLRLLQLEGNRLKHLHSSTFSTFSLMGRFHLSTLRHLYLSNNSLSVVHRQMLDHMPQLENLFLQGNPWICDCSMRWIHRWLQAAPGVLKCKKDRSLPGGQQCPTCSSPLNLHQKPLQTLDNMVCSSPVIKSLNPHAKPEQIADHFTFLDEFIKPHLGNISLELSDEHGNEVHLQCSIGEPRDASKISFEQVDDAKMASNVTLSLDLECDVDRETYERLWRLIAYYSSVPAHLKRGIMLTKDPNTMYAYRQDPDKDALYFTGMKANIMALPSWLMQEYVDLQLNRHGSSGKKVKLILTTVISQDLDLEMVHRQPRPWVRVQETGSTHKAVILGKSFDLQCSAQSSSEPVITWILPDGTKLAAPSGSNDERMSISADGRLVVEKAEHSNTGSYYCIARVDEDIAVLAFYVAVQDSSNPQPDENQATPTELFAGNSLNLDCEALGSPNPEVQWIIPNGNIVSFRSNSSRVFVYSNGTLHIPQSLPPDNGFYKCVALNQYGVDSKVAKVTVNRRPGTVRPLRRIPMRPQSAAGVNTKIKVELNGLEDGSGDVEEDSALKPTRKVVSVRNGALPSRKTWRRPPIMLRKPNLQSTESGKNILDHRRRITMAKINPDRWANIWAKIRTKNGRFTTTASPRHTTQFRKLTTSMQESTSIENYATTYVHEAIEGSSDGAREKTNQESTTMSIFEAESTYSFPSTSLEALTSQRFPNLQQTTSSNAFFLPQTTSAPLQAVTLWQATLNTQEQSSKSMTSPREQGTELDRDKPADSKRPKEKRNRKNKTRLSKLNKSKSEEAVPTVVPVTSRREDKMIFSSQKPKSEAIISVVSPTTAQIWNKQQSSKRRNGNRKKKPTRFKNKLKKTVNIDDLYVERVQSSEVASSELNIQVENGQKPTSSTMDHKTSTKAFSKSFQIRSFTANQVQGFITTAFPETRLDMLPSNSQQEFTSPPLAPVKPSAQIPMQNAIADSSSEELRHVRGKLIQSRQGNMAPEGRKHLANGSWEQSATRSSPLASLTEREAGEMYRSEDKSELVATTGIDFEVLSATIHTETNQDYIGNQYLMASTTALPMSTNYLASPRWKESDKLSISINESPQKPQNSIESLNFSNTAFSQTTTAPQMFKVTSQIFPQNQQIQEEVVNLNLEAKTQTPSILVSLDTDEQNQAAPTKSVFLQTFEAKTSETASLSTEKSTILPLFQTFTTKKPPISKGISKTDEEDQNNERNYLLTTQQPPSISTRGKTINQNQNNGAKSIYFLNSVPQNSTLTPVVLGASTQKATSMSTSGKTVKQDKNIEAESTNFYNSVAQNSTYSPNLSEDSTEKTSSFSITQKSQGDLVKTPTAAFSDFVTQSSNHRMDQSINSNPSIPVINVRTTLAPNYSPILVHSWTERPRARTTPRLPARRGKPWITRSNFQTTSVKAETDAVLPCAANGEPKPFLSWTKVSTGTSIPQNTILQRFEVHANGTLIIRNTQPVDGGEYVCTVQNQHGSDRALTNLVVLSQHPKILQPRHRDFSVNLGSNIDIDCQVEGHPTPRVTWVLPNHVQVAASAFGVVRNRISILPNGTLRIIQAGFSDRGIYKCVGSSSSGADTVSVRLYVSAMPPVLRQIPIENITAVENGIVFLPCSANGSPQPTIRWTTPDNIQLTSSQYLNGQKTMVFPNGTLFMQSLSQKNAGRYECLASNVLGTSRRTVNLAVKSQALMTKASIAVSSAKLTEVVYGGELRLDCQAVGEPRPRVIWRTPSRKLVDSHFSFDPRIRVFPNGSISVGAVTDADAGDYLCVARNRLGDDYVLLRVVVLTKPAKIEQKPQRSSQEVVYGGNLKVDCVASGLPNPEISWALPDGTMVNPEKDQDRLGIAPGRRRRYVVFDNGTLFFNDVGMREEGDYTCYAENQLGKDEMKIHVKVKNTAFRPQIRNKLQTSTLQVIYGENFTLSCDAGGEPAPVFTWMSPINRVIFPNKDKYQVLSNGKLTVLKAQRFDSGDYTCTARNNVGQDTKVVKVEVLVIPPVISNTLGLNSEVSVFQNDRIWLDCVASGTPTPRIMWVLPGNVILPASYRSKRMTVYQNGTLEIHAIKRSDAGLLACIARNEGGEVRLAVHLNVKEANANRLPVSGSKMETVSLNAGNAITLSCGLEGDSFSSLTWVLPNGTPLLSGTRFAKFFHRQDGSLVISNPSLAEAGTYRCLGHNNGRQVEQIVQLEPGRKPEIENRFDSSASFDVKEENANRMLISGNTMETALLTAGNAITLSCGYEDNSLSSLTWVLPNGTPLVSGARFAKFSHRQDGSLVISNPTLAETGTYRCSGRDNGRQVERIVQLEPGRKPENVNHYNASTGFDFKEDNANQMLVSENKMETVSLTAGSAMTLTCNSEGDTFSSLTWVLPNGTPLVSGARFAKFFHRQDGSLVISNPTLADAGTYRCLGRNNGRQIEQIVQLEPGRKPEIVNRYNSSISIIHGETLMLHCVTDGDPLRLTWTLPSEVVLNRPQKAGRYSLLPNGTLAIQQISVYDRGLYVCRAANEYGSTSMSASVIVIAYPPRITDGPNAVTFVKSGVAVQLNCIATGIPEVEVAWETPDKNRLVVRPQPRLFGNKYLHPQGSLVIQNPTQRDVGVYRCTARNVMGTDSRTTQLRVFK